MANSKYDFGGAHALFMFAYELHPFQVSNAANQLKCDAGVKK